MKIAKLLSAAAVAALIASPAAADAINKGQYFGPQVVPVFGIPLPVGPIGTHDVGGGLLGGLNLVNASANFGAVSGLVPAWHAVGGAVGQIQTADQVKTSTFTLKGKVTKDCAFYTGTGNQILDFGTIGIYADDRSGPAAAFDMTNDAEVTIYSNLAGCNAANLVSLSKNDIRGLVNNASDGYDTNVFQANLPYSVDARYTAGPIGQVVAATESTQIALSTTANWAGKEHGAWKSPMAISVKIPAPSKSLLAGNYEGDLTVEIRAY
ncbi:hypothetical protein [Brevundimonas sp.]|uniref:hypothetical protein n=1 Tax=Brevundimonas sp. TaxID=1871086 RepID=UPI002897A485|nr:hypothetical protein [Brevundimonas sp.]